MRKFWAIIAVASITGCATSNSGEVKMKYADAPTPVKAGLKREAPSAEIVSVEREVENGMTVYEADVMQDGKKWEVKVDETGKLISKKMSDDDGKDD